MSLLMDDDQTFRFPSPLNKASPTSSNEVEADDDTPDPRALEGSPIQLLDGEWQLMSSSSPSPVDSDSNPFSDANSQKNEAVDNDEIPKP